MDDFDQLKSTWGKGRENLPQSSVESKTLIKAASESKNKSQKAQIATIIILSITLLVLIYFFTEIAQFQQILSRVGVLMMCGGLLIRIAIEAISLSKSNSLNMALNSEELTKRLLDYYHYRVKIHGGFTYTILGLYIIGFYFLTPEFSLYLDLTWVWIMDIGFVFIAIALFYIIRKSVLNELAALKKFNSINEDLVQG